MGESWQPVTPLENEDRPAPQRRPFDYVSLVFGLVFIAIAVVGMTGVDVPVRLFTHGGILWGFLVLAGLALLFSELRRPRSR